MGMCGARVALCLLALAYVFGPIVSKPTMFDMCDIFCDDDGDSSGSSDDSDYWLFDPCAYCPPRTSGSGGGGGGGGGATPSSNGPNRPNSNQPPSQGVNVSLQLPPSKLGMNLTVSNVGGSWLMNLVPWVFGGAPQATTGAPTAAPATTAAPTTAAAAAKAGNATTAAATTKKK